MSLPALFMCMLVAAALAVQPEQVTVGYINATHYTFTWALSSAPTAPQMVLVSNGNSVGADCTQFAPLENPSLISYRCRAIAPVPSGVRTLPYRVGSSTDGWEELVLAPVFEPTSSMPLNVGVYGDMGLQNPQVLSAVTAAAQSGKINAVFHLGDFAYDLEDNFGAVGDAFQRLLQPLASSLAYQVLPGNHENDQGTFHQFKERFTMASWNDTQNMLYAFDMGPLHVVSINSEAYYTEDPVTTAGPIWNWLHQHLSNFRASGSQQWLIVMGHRPLYCSAAKSHHPSETTDDCSKDAPVMRNGVWNGNAYVYGLESLFSAYRVDLYLSGHVHYYERLDACFADRPVVSPTSNHLYNPTAPTYIVSGAAGCDEEPKDFNSDSPSPCSSAHSSSYSFGILSVSNQTSLAYTQYASDGTTVLDQLTISRDMF